MGDKEPQGLPIGVSIEGMEKGMEDVSRLARAYYVALKNDGFIDEIALDLTKDFLSAWWFSTFAKTDG